MPRYTQQQVTAVAKGAGLTGEPLAIAVAIAGWHGAPASGESFGGNTDAVGDVALQNGKWGPSIGLWQIRSLKEHLGTGQVRDERQLSDPTFNARSMMKISSNGTNWQPWSYYTSGLYLKNLKQARLLADGSGIGKTGSPDSGGGLSAISGFAGGLMDVGLWKRIGTGALGVSLVSVGVLVIGGDTVVKAAIEATPIGKVL